VFGEQNSVFGVPRWVRKLEIFESKVENLEFSEDGKLGYSTFYCNFDIWQQMHIYAFSQHRKQKFSLIFGNNVKVNFWLHWKFNFGLQYLQFATDRGTLKTLLNNAPGSLCRDRCAKFTSAQKRQKTVKNCHFFGISENWWSFRTSAYDYRKV